MVAISSISMGLFEGLTVVDAVIYLFLLVFAIYVWKVENTDIHCPTFHSSTEECSSQGGMAYSNTSPLTSDTCSQILDKMVKAGSAETATIKWRRSFLLAVGIVFALCILVLTPTTLPSWPIFLIAVAITYLIIFMNFEYYDYHVFAEAEKNVKEGARLLKEKGCIPINR